MASKEIHSSFTSPEKHLSSAKSKNFLSLNHKVTRRGAVAISFATSLYLADGSVPQNIEATSYKQIEPTETSASTATPTPPVGKEAEKAPGISIPMPDQQTLQAISAFGSLLSGAGLITATFALFQLRKQAKASEDAARAAEVTAEASMLAARVSMDAATDAAYANRYSSYQNLMATGDSINATFLEHPELYNQVFETPHVRPASIKRTSNRQKNTQVLATALRFADFFELVLVQREVIPAYLRDSWEQYMKTCLKNSQSLRNLIRDTDWYGGQIKQFNVAVEQEMEQEAAASAQRGQRFQRARKLVQPILKILRKR